MAKIVPTAEEIASLPTPLTKGEEHLLAALVGCLDDSWKVYVQPHMNGLRPDFVLFNPDAGLAIIEVKDWNLDAYRIQGGAWYAYSGGRAERLPDRHCPFRQVKEYKEALIRYELPVIGAHVVLNPKVLALVTPIVFFSLHDEADAAQRLSSVIQPYVHVMGKNTCTVVELPRFLHRVGLKGNSMFRGILRQPEFVKRLENALSYPTHGSTDLAGLLAPRSDPRKMALLHNPAGRRQRLLGSAGSGKSTLLINKAIEGAIAQKQVLLVCFNITMVNYLRDLVNRLGRYFGKHLPRHITVCHYHRLFTLSGQWRGQLDFLKGSVEVLLIDEGQDFQQQEWLDNLLALCAADSYVMFAEDNRQRIYANARRVQIPGAIGRPHKLHESFRLPHPFAQLANSLVRWQAARIPGAYEFEPDQDSGEIVSYGQPNLLYPIVWYEGDLAGAIDCLVADIEYHLNHAKRPLADTVILVTRIEDGRLVDALLRNCNLPTQRTFESQQEYEMLVERCGKGTYILKEKLDEVRRRYKAAFWMQGGRIKLATVHSFKGWGLSNVFVLHTPSDQQDDLGEALLYTALTRSLDTLNVYNCDPEIGEFADYVLASGLAQAHPRS